MEVSSVWLCADAWGVPYLCVGVGVVAGCTCPGFQIHSMRSPVASCSGRRTEEAPEPGRGCWAVFVALGGKGMVRLKPTSSEEAALSLDGPGALCIPSALVLHAQPAPGEGAALEEEFGGGLGAGTLTRRRLEEKFLVTLPPLPGLEGISRAPTECTGVFGWVDHLETFPWLAECLQTLFCACEVTLEKHTSRFYLQL